MAKPLKKTQRKTAKTQTPLGRPKIEFDLGTVQGLGGIGATYDEMASVLCVSVKTISKNMQEEGGFFEAYQRGFATLKISLRRKQIELAKNGNLGMLIWLGKNLLGQADKQEIGVEQHIKQEIHFDDIDGAV